MSNKKSGENSSEMREAIEKARRIQEERFLGENFRFNSGIPAYKIDKYCKMTAKARMIMDKAYKKYSLSVRSYHKLIRVARTIADLDGALYIEETHISEALGYRTEVF